MPLSRGVQGIAPFVNSVHLDKLKAILRITDNTYDDVLKIFLQMAEQSVLNYINRTLLPPELYHVVIRIAAISWLTDDALSEDAADSEVDSVTIAGVNIRYGLNQAQREILQDKLDDAIRNEAELKQFRSLFRIARPQIVDPPGNGNITGNISPAYFEINE